MHTTYFKFPVCLWILLGVHGDRCTRGSSEEQDRETDCPIRAANDGLQRKMGYVTETERERYGTSEKHYWENGHIMGQVGYVIGKMGHVMEQVGYKFGKMCHVMVTNRDKCRTL